MAYTPSAPGLRRTTQADLDKRRKKRSTESMLPVVRQSVPGPLAGPRAAPAPAPALALAAPSMFDIVKDVAQGWLTPPPGAEPESGIMPFVERVLPGGQSGYDLSGGTHGVVIKEWWANGALFQQNQDGTISVLKKNGQVKTYRPFKPTVFGKEPDAKKFIKMAKKHKKIYQELHKIFKTKGR